MSGYVAAAAGLVGVLVAYALDRRRYHQRG